MEFNKIVKKIELKSLIVISMERDCKGMNEVPRYLGVLVHKA